MSASRSAIPAAAAHRGGAVDDLGHPAMELAERQLHLVQERPEGDDVARDPALRLQDRDRVAPGNLACRVVLVARELEEELLLAEPTAEDERLPRLRVGLEEVRERGEAGSRASVGGSGAWPRPCAPPCAASRPAGAAVGVSRYGAFSVPRPPGGA